MHRTCVHSESVPVSGLSCETECVASEMHNNRVFPLALFCQINPYQHLDDDPDHAKNLTDFGFWISLFV